MPQECCWNCMHFRITRAPHGKTELIEPPTQNYCQDFLNKTGKQSPLNLSEPEKLLVFRKPCDCCGNYMELDYSQIYF
ncbi:MAG: hypothetical protein KKH91_06195 [Elusimicrobia bacterium]|nr:hypothetical protein [Elusimicrobiota bacterium]MBU2615376.1 hypothetical protein [Elusimicrobiota bacterium]